MAALHGSLSRIVQTVNEESQARFELRFVVVCSIVARKVRAIPGEDAELALPGAVADGPQRSKIAPVVRRMLLAACQPEDAAMELRQRAVEAEGLVGLLLQARAIVLRAGADQRPALGEQRPGARDVGEGLFLVLGQQQLAKLIGAALDPGNRPTSRPSSGAGTRAETTARRRHP
jgi:hypothetical protein